MAAIIPAVTIGTAAGQQLPLMFGDALDQLQSGGPIYLRDGVPKSLVGQIGLAVGRSACRRYAVGNVGLTPDRAEKYETACRPYLNDIGYGPGQGLRLPYRGAQCAARYRVEYTATAPTGISGDGGCVGTQNVAGAIEVWGPVSNVGLGETVCSGGAGGGAKRGTFTAFSNLSGPQLTEPFTGSFGNAFYTLDVGAVTRLDGLADDCGNVAPVPVPTGDEPDPTPPPFIFNPSANVDINVDVQIGPDGDIIFDIGTGPITINPFPEDGEGGGGATPAGGGGDGAPGDPTAAGEPAFVGEPGGQGQDVEFGPPPDGRVWVGCLAQFIAPVSFGDIPGTAGSNRAYPRVVGNLSLKYAGGRGDARQVRSEWNQAFRPVTALQVNGAFVNSLPGVVVTIRPVSAIVCPESTCGGNNG